MERKRNLFAAGFVGKCLFLGRDEVVEKGGKGVSGGVASPRGKGGKGEGRRLLLGD